MALHVNVRSYRPQPVSSRTGRSTAFRLSHLFTGEQRKYLAVMGITALIAGLSITQFFHGRMADMQAGAEKLRIVNAAISNENVRLLASRAQLSSKPHIVSSVGAKLNLFEPEKGQVHRM